MKIVRLFQEYWNEILEAYQMNSHRTSIPPPPPPPAPSEAGRVLGACSAAARRAARSRQVQAHLAALNADIERVRKLQQDINAASKAIKQIKETQNG